MDFFQKIINIFYEPLGICIAAYIVLINLVLFIIMGLDKSRAKKGLRRISESCLFLVAVIGGSFGGTIAMYIFRHKTKHWSFVVGFPVILVLQLIFALWFLGF